MWRLAVVLSLLWPSAVFGGQTRGQMQVGMIITGKSGSTTIKPKAATGAKNSAAVASPAEPAKARSGSTMVRRNAVPAIP
jgi:hypothetical protein